jgi:hypothetical protein
MGKTPPDTSAGGSKLLRHTARAEGFTPAAESAATEEIAEHFAKHFGEPASVFHEILSDLVHIDVHIIRPTPERDHWTLFTTGMSDLPMTAPEAAHEYRHAELMIALPRQWQVDALAVTPPPADLERWYWPIRWLKQLARLPHEYRTWLGFGHSIPNGDPPQAFSPETKLCGWLLLPPITVPDEARTIALADGRVVHLYVLHALHLAEMSLKLDKGTDALLDAFDAAGVSEVLDVARASTVKTKLFGLF